MRRNASNVFTFLVWILGLMVLASAPAYADTYTYDALGRLVGVVFSDGSTITYTYDAAGNRTVVTQTAP